MICEDCKEAGRYVAEAEADPHPLEPDLGRPEYLLQRAKALHARCLGGTWCYCAHRI